MAIVRKGGKKAVIPLAPRTARAIDLAIGERCQGPIFLTASASGWTGIEGADREREASALGTVAERSAACPWSR